MNIFGTDGVRGKVGEGVITPESFVRLGWAIGKTLVDRRRRRRRSKVLIGRDTRVSGPMLESALQSGLTAAGADVLVADVLPTPAVAWLTQSLKCTAGLMVSASHNRYTDNGLKVFDAAGCKLTDDTIAAVEAAITRPVVMVESQRLGHVQRIGDAAGRYIEHCKSCVPGELDLGDMKLIIDCANGAVHPMVSEIFGDLGAEVLTMGDSPNGININDRCGSTDTAALQQAVVERKADMGISFDGDGDRVLFVDRHGKQIDGDQLLFILAAELQQTEGGCAGVVGTEMSNMGLEQSLQALGIPFARTPVGDCHVRSRMDEHGWPLGGEPSGHIICSGLSTTGDGILSALRVLTVLWRSGKDLETLAGEMRRQFQLTVDVPGDRSRLGDCPTVVAAQSEAQRQLGSGRIVLRPSGTEEVVRVTVEGEDAQLVRRLARQLAKEVGKAIA